MIYLICFAASVFCADLAYKEKERWKFILYSALSILLPVLLATFRSYSVGTDTLNYLTKEEFWGGAIAADSIGEFFYNIFQADYEEPLFALLIGVVAQWTGEYRVFLFLVHLVIMICVYIGIYRYRKSVNPVLVLLLFYLFFYNYSLNIMRQFMAMAIVFAFAADIQEGRFLRYCIAVIVATLIHTTAVISIGLLLLYIFVYFRHEKFSITIQKREYSLACVLYLVVLFFAPVMRVLTGSGARYSFFVSEGLHSPSIVAIAISTITVFFAIMHKKQLSKRFKYFEFQFMCSVCHLILLQMSYSIVYGRRIAMYFSFVDLITIAMFESTQLNLQRRKAVRNVIVAIALLYWVYSYPIANGSGTIPYAFGF